MTHTEAEELLAAASMRKRRLLACACIRSMWHLVPHELRAAVIEEEDLHPTTFALIVEPVEPEVIKLEDGSTVRQFAEGQDVNGWVEQPPAEPVDDTPDGLEYLDVVAEVLIPCEFLPEWRTETVLALAQAMYDSRDFAAMPILADALADAGCEDEAILTHCRGMGPHVRGCFCVDAILGRS